MGESEEIFGNSNFQQFERHIFRHIMSSSFSFETNNVAITLQLPPAIINFFMGDIQEAVGLSMSL
jgi:hypothetical protein